MIVAELDEELETRPLYAGSMTLEATHGVFMTPGVEEEWTLSIAHSQEDLERFAAALEAFARDVTAG